MPGDAWTVEAVDMIIAMTAKHRIARDGGRPYPDAEWKDTGPRHKIDLLGYLEVNDGLWFWRTEFAVGLPPTNDRRGWITVNGQGIKSFETREYAEIVPVIAGSPRLTTWIPTDMLCGMDFLTLANSIQSIRATGGDEDTLTDLVERICTDFKDTPGFDRSEFYRAAMGPA